MDPNSSNPGQGDQGPAAPQLKVDLSKYKRGSAPAEKQGQQPSKEQQSIPAQQTQAPMPAIDLDKYRKAPKKAEQDQEQAETPLAQAEIVRRQMLARHHRLRQVGHEKVNFNYLDMYEEQAQHQRKMEQAFQEREKIIEGENEANRPAFFQRDERMEELRKKQINEGLEPWRQEEYDAYKQMRDKTEVDFTKEEFQDHEKVRDYFKISK